MGKQSAKFRFGKRIRALRLKREWTQRKLAHRAGISERYLQRIESKQPPDVTLDVIAKLARSLKLECWQIVE